MKTQMRFQKILMIATLVIGALGVVYALIFCSGGFNQLCLLGGEGIDGVDKFIKKVQSSNDTLFTLGIVYVVVCLLPLIAACQKRRKYYITNYIAIGVVVVFQIIYSILLVVTISNVMKVYNKADFETASLSYELFDFAVQYGDFSTKPWTPTVGYVLMGVSLVDAVLLVLNVVWKVLLTMGEKKLLNPNKPADTVADGAGNTDSGENGENNDVVSEVI